MKSVTALMLALQAELVEDERRIVLKRATLASLQSLYGAAPRPPGRPPGARVAPGSLEARILEAVSTGPTQLAAIVTHAKARRADVERAVKALVSAGQLTQKSAGRWRTYSRSK